MIEIKISGATVAEIQATMAKLLSSGAAPNTPEDAMTPAETPKQTRTRKKAEEPKQSIQTGEERVGPEDTAEDQQQDAADEEADSKGGEELTHDSVRAALGEYVKLFGMPAAQEDGPKVISMMFGKDKSKVSDIPDDQDSLKKAVAGVQEMIAKNPFKREKVK